LSLITKTRIWGLDAFNSDFNPIVSALIARKETVTVSEAYQQLLAFETCMDMFGLGQSGSSANTTNRGGRGNGGGRGYNGSRGGGRGYNGGGRGNGGRVNFNNNQRQGSNGGGGRGGFFNKNSNRAKPVCQVCFKEGHTAYQCWHRFEENYVPEEKHVSAAMNSYNVDTNRYTGTGTGTTDHITGELEKLAVRNKYNDVDQIHTANGAGMRISHIGKSTIHTPARQLYLKNILHVPSTKKNLVPVHRLASDNNVFFEFHPDHFLIKDRDTKSTLLEGPCRKGLYPLPSASSSSKQAFGVNKVSIHRWHSRLGHPTFPVVEKVLRSNNLPHLLESNKQSVFGACQEAKSHQLPYPISTSVSTQPLELVFSDVWGPSIDSVGRYKYYVSFIDDFSKFTWIYLLKYKFEVFQKFHEFQSLVERLFDRKIVVVQSDWGGEYERLNSFFTKVGITHLVSCPHAHQQNGAAERKHRH
jgi:histone deacetylase 1/2